MGDYILAARNVLIIAHYCVIELWINSLPKIILQLLNEWRVCAR